MQNNSYFRFLLLQRRNAPTWCCISTFSVSLYNTPHFRSVYIKYSIDTLPTEGSCIWVVFPFPYSLLQTSDQSNQKNRIHIGHSSSQFRSLPFTSTTFGCFFILFLFLQYTIQKHCTCPSICHTLAHNMWHENTTFSEKSKHSYVSKNKSWVIVVWAV